MHGRLCDGQAVSAWAGGVHALSFSAMNSESAEKMMSAASCMLGFPLRVASSMKGISSGQSAMFSVSTFTPSWPTASQIFFRMCRSVSLTMHASSSDLTTCLACADSLASDDEASPASEVPACITDLRSSTAHMERTCGFWFVRSSCTYAGSRVSGLCLACLSASSAWLRRLLSGESRARIICSN
jgi:hypothetical protein